MVLFVNFYYICKKNMAHPLIHAKSSVKKNGGKIEDYIPAGSKPVNVRFPSGSYT